MKWKSLDLKKATIFDLTEDPKIISQFWEPTFLCPTKEDFIKLEQPIQGRISTLLQFAALTNDKELENAVHETFKKELLTFGFE